MKNEIKALCTRCSCDEKTCGCSNLFIALRKEFDLTQGELASTLKMKQGYVSRLENNLCTPSLKTLIKVKEAFEKDWLFLEKFYGKK